jgi:arylsulfatase
MAPNIVFILVDNVGWGTFGVYGNMIPTPCIDKMAGECLQIQQLQRGVSMHADPLGHHDWAASGSLGNLHDPFPRAGTIWDGTVGIYTRRPAL